MQSRLLSRRGGLWLKPSSSANPVLSFQRQDTRVTSGSGGLARYKVVSTNNKMDSEWSKAWLFQDMSPVPPASKLCDPGNWLPPNVTLNEQRWQELSADYASGNNTLNRIHGYIPTPWGPFVDHVSLTYLDSVIRKTDGGLTDCVIIMIRLAAGGVALLEDGRGSGPPKA
jgi:hypothetical protein